MIEGIYFLDLPPMQMLLRHFGVFYKINNLQTLDNQAFLRTTASFIDTYKITYTRDDTKR